MKLNKKEARKYLTSLESYNPFLQFLQSMLEALYLLHVKLPQFSPETSLCFSGYAGHMYSLSPQKFFLIIIPFLQVEHPTVKQLIRFFIIRFTPLLF